MRSSNLGASNVTESIIFNSRTCRVMNQETRKITKRISGANGILRYLDILANCGSEMIEY